MYQSHAKNINTVYKKILNSQLRRMKKFGPTFHFYNVKLLGRLESSAGQVNPIPPPPFPPFSPRTPTPPSLLMGVALRDGVRVTQEDLSKLLPINSL